MGALGPAGPWIPEDDLLLKNAVEAGASLESLAKGAVPFSRRYSVRELQERWHNLLYDPIISAEASALMMEFERSSPMHSSKLHKFGSSKDSKCMSGKRKAGSVRNCYYDLRKRISNEQFNPTSTYIVGPGNSHYVRNDNGHLNGNCMLGDGEPDSSQFELPEADFEIIHEDFPHLLDDIGVEQNTIHDVGIVELGPEASHFGQSEEMLNCSLIEANGHDGENICSEIEDGHVFNPSILDGGTSFHSLDSSPLPGMSIWKGVEGISGPPLPDDISLGEKDLHEGETFIMGDNNDNDASTSGYDLIHSESDLINHVPDDDPLAANTGGYNLEELSKSLLDFSNEEELDVMDKSYYEGLSSLLLNSPDDANLEELHAVTEGMIVSSDACFPNESVICPQDTDDNMIVDVICRSEEQIHLTPSAQFPQPCEPFVFCAFNTEDPEIPCNDDVVFPKRFAPKSASLKPKFRESNGFSSAKEGTVNQGSLERIPSLVKREHHQIQSQTVGSQALGKPFNHPNGVRSDGDSRVVTARTTGQMNPSMMRSEHGLSVPHKEEPFENLHNSTDASPDKLMNGCDEFERFLQQNAGDSVQQTEASGVHHDPQFLQPEIPADLGIPEFGTRVNSSASEPAESDDDDDVPSFSDIEAMILDMDLEPDDTDLFSNEEVLRYNNEEMKRKIVRLELGAHSYMHRAIASQGAFAVLYGRYSKHYIRKPEVLLGRGTEDFNVDIDLAKEGRFNKISRRQAMIKLETSGQFLLKNLGKCPILVNDKEVAPGQSLNLTSNCLVEIKGLAFIFETNPKRVKQFLNCITDKS